MKRACVLGGGGFLGINLSNYLVESGWQVRSYGRPPAMGGHASGVDHIDGEFGDHARLSNAIDGCDVVYHLVSSSNPSMAEQNREADNTQNVGNSLKLFDMGIGGAYGRLVFVSSGGTVYGVPEKLPIPEDAPQWPISSYGIVKLAIERYLHLYHHQHALDYAVARISNPFGPHQHTRRGQGVIAMLLHSATSGGTFNLVGNGGAIRDYLYVADAMEALEQCSGSLSQHRIFNVGTGHGYSIMQLIEIVEDVTGRSIALSRLPARPVDVPANILDVSLAERELGWRARTSLQDGVQKHHDWQRALGNG